MNRDETVALFLEGRSAWDAWAEDILARRKSLEETGRWASERDLAGVIQPRNKETASWVEAAAADFSRVTLEISARAELIGNGELAECIDFNGFVFPGNTSFSGTKFLKDASFISAKFLADASFEDASFQAEGQFDLCQFIGRANFTKAKVAGRALFREAQFHRRALFNNCALMGETSFFDVEFRRSTRFIGCAFQDVSFRNVKFFSKAEFLEARFGGWSLFEGATFSGYADFKKSVFWGYPNFVGILSERAFDLAGATFASVPDFIQAHFEEAPRLDNLRVLSGRLADSDASARWRASRRHQVKLIEGIGGRRDAPARWRALRRLAIQGHDTDRELEFHAGEVKSRRFAGDWPLPWPVWQSRAWNGFFNFWFGHFYQVFSDFGRSLARPLIWWSAAITLGAVTYVSQSPQIIEARQKQEAKGAWVISAAASRAWHAWLSKAVPCYAGEVPSSKDKNGDTPVYVGALSNKLAEGTDLANEAWHLAFRNGFIILDGSSEAAHRTYGCLYGVELYGGSNPLAVVPSAVSTASAIQKLFSGLMIFLFGLALRNMLKMK